MGDVLSYLNCAFRCTVIVFFASTASPALALSLTEALDLARHSDPQLLTAQANQRVARERSAQAFGAILPQASIAINTTGNRRNYQVQDSDAPPARNIYNSNSAQLNVTQAIFHRSNQIALLQSSAAERQAGYLLLAAEQDLLVRLTQAWFDLMLARDVLVYSNAQVAATEYLSRQAVQAAASGLASGPMREEATSKYAQAVAELAGAESDQNLKLAALEQITGALPPLTPPMLSDAYVARDPRSESLAQFLQYVEQNNPQILAAVNGVEAAAEEIRKQRTGHEITIDAVGSYGRTVQNTGSFPGQSGSEVKLRAIGLQVNIPLYSGGTQSAKVGEAIALRDKTAQELEAAKRQARLNAKQAWFGWQTGDAHQLAALQMRKSADLALQAATQGKRLDVKSDADVLQARQQRDSALRDYQKARYEKITSYIKLQSTIGQLQDADVTALDRWLVAQRDSTKASLP